MPSPPRHAPGCACRRGALRCDANSPDDLGAAAVRAAVERAAFGGEAGRRRILSVLGAGGVAAALDRAFPILRAREALAETGGAPEKKDLKVGFIPITCATPIIMAAPMGFYARNGLNVEVVRTAGWAVVRDNTNRRKF